MFVGMPIRNPQYYYSAKMTLLSFPLFFFYFHECMWSRGILILCVLLALAKLKYFGDFGGV